MLDTTRRFGADGFTDKAERRMDCDVLSSEHVTMELILERQWAAAAERCAREQVVLAVQDNTTRNHDGFGPWPSGSGSAVVTPEVWKTSATRPWKSGNADSDRRGTSRTFHSAASGSVIQRGMTSRQPFTSAIFSIGLPRRRPPGASVGTSRPSTASTKP